MGFALFTFYEFGDFWIHQADRGLQSVGYRWLPNVVLLTKVAKSVRINQFHPISLCNVIYRFFIKVLVNRMRVISPMEGSFLPKRLISDNIVLIQEVVHCMIRKYGKKGWVLLKFDLEKLMNIFVGTYTVEVRR